MGGFNGRIVQMLFYLDVNSFKQLDCNTFPWNVQTFRGFLVTDDGGFKREREDDFYGK